MISNLIDSATKTTSMVVTIIYINIVMGCVVIIMLIDIVSNAMVAMMLPMLMFGQGASAVLMNIVMVSDILLTWVVLAPLIIVSDSRCR